MIRFQPEGGQRGLRIAAVVLAAGEGRRIGGPKALLRVAGESFLARTTRVLAAAGASPLILVLGHEAERVQSEAGALPEAVSVVNAAYPEGMLGSVLLGLDAAEARDAQAILLHPVDHPLVARATVEHVLAALRGGARIVVPGHAGRRGHPAGFAAAAWPALRQAPAELGARAALRSHPDWIVQVPGDVGCVAGIETRADYERWIGNSLTP